MTQRHQPPTITGRRTLVPGPKYSYEELTIRSSSGEERKRPIVQHPGAVVVLPILDDGRLVFIRNFRTAVESAGAWVLEFCAGTLDVPGEDPVDAAARELIEETGYSATAITPMLIGDAESSAGYFYTTPGLTSERMFPFLATGLTHVGQHLEPDETIELVFMSPAEAWTAVDQGGTATGGRAGRTLMDAKSIVALTLATRRGLVRI
ncbi:MAG TPA: NUDIX hydrolase [Phycisphaerales bacterium]|nr:NUDIX hydrolase [Phycisphaerales bacterium]